MEKKSFICQLYNEPHRVWEVRCNRELRVPVHPFLGSHNLIKEDIIKAIQGMSLRTTLDGKMVNESSSSSSGASSENGDGSCLLLHTNTEQFKNLPIDTLLTTGIHISALVNPNSVAKHLWNVQLIHWWLCREPNNPGDDLILNRVKLLRRYGTYRNFEVFCNFKKNTDTDASRSSKFFWIHVNCLLFTPSYRQKFIKEYAWDWSKVESDFYESKAEEDNIDICSDNEASTPASSLVSLRNYKEDPAIELQPVLYRSYPINCLSNLYFKK
jgi:hypothetical protein